MVLAFLQAEIANTPEWARFVIKQPNLEDESENERRRCLLSSRGYGWNMFLFQDFPGDVSWHRARLAVKELGAARYIDREPTWHSLSKGTRLIADGASNFASRSVHNETTAVIRAIAAGLEQGRSLPELIFVGLPESRIDDLVLVEGHKRATAYVYAGKPAEINALVGFSPGISGWYWF